jgi:polyisoprenyl-phosphate glycosyltransferase
MMVSSLLLPQAVTPQVGSALPRIGVVIPFYNEREVLPQCLERVLQVLNELALPYDVLLVDDGSHDDSAAWLTQHFNLHSEAWPQVPMATAPHPRPKQLRLLQLSRNFGKEAALSAGLRLVEGDFVLILDADLQDPPELLPLMLAKAQQGVDVVVMQRRARWGDTWFKRNSAHLFYRLLGLLSTVPIPADTGDFRLMSRACVTALNALPESNRFMKGLFAWVGFTTATLNYDRDPRLAGRSKWGMLKLLGLALDGVTSFSTLPLRLASVLGLVMALAGGCFGVWMLVNVVLWSEPMPGYPSLMVVMMLFGGAQLMAVGLLGEYVGKIYLEVKRRPLYVVQGLHVAGLSGPEA